MTHETAGVTNPQGQLTGEHVALLLATNGPEEVHTWLTDWVEQGFPSVYISKSEAGETLRWKRRILDVETFEYRDVPEE